MIKYGERSIEMLQHAVCTAATGKWRLTGRDWATPTAHWLACSCQAPRVGARGAGARVAWACACGVAASGAACGRREGARGIRSAPMSDVE